MRTGSRAKLWLAVAAVALASSGFAWPGQGERLVKELTSASTPRDKRDALRLLRIRLERGEWLPDQAPEVLALLVNDRDLDVRLDALRLAAQLERTPATWLRACEDPAPPVRVAAIEALAAVGELEPVLHASGDADARVRLSALAALAKRDDPRITELLVSALRDPASNMVRIRELR